MNRFKIISPIYNSRNAVEFCVNSVLSQDYLHWEMIFIDDCSTDGTELILRDLASKHEKIKYHRNDTRQYMSYNRLLGGSLLNCCDDDILIFLDGDDSLSNNRVLSILDKHYRSEVWVTWGSFVYSSNGKKGRDSAPFRFINPVRSRWIFSHLKSMRYFVFRNIPKYYFISSRSGEYYKICTDLALMYPAIEMSGKGHVKYISDILYTYNNIRTAGRRSFSEAKKERSFNVSDIRKKKKMVPISREKLIQQKEILGLVL